MPGVLPRWTVTAVSDAQYTAVSSESVDFRRPSCLRLQGYECPLGIASTVVPAMADGGEQHRALLQARLVPKLNPGLSECRPAAAEPAEKADLIIRRCNGPDKTDVVS